MSSSEQGNRPGAAPPRVTGAATAAAAAAASRTAPASAPSGYGRDAGPGLSVNHSAASEASGGQWASAAAPPTAPPSRPSARPNPQAQSGAMYGAAPAPGGGPRSVRLTVAGLDPWSVLKLSFLLSVAIGIAMVVAAVVLWSVLDGMGVFDQVNRVMLDITGTEGKFNVYNYVGLGRVVSLSTVLGVVNVVLMTALSTLGAFLYNLGAGLVGGLHVTLTDD